MVASLQVEQETQHYYTVHIQEVQQWEVANHLEACNTVLVFRYAKIILVIGIENFMGV